MHNNAIRERLVFSSYDKEEGRRKENKIVKWIVGHSDQPDIPNLMNADGSSNQQAIDDLHYPFTKKDRLNVCGVDALLGVVSGTAELYHQPLETIKPRDEHFAVLRLP